MKVSNTQRRTKSASCSNSTSLDETVIHWGSSSVTGAARTSPCLNQVLEENVCANSSQLEYVILSDNQFILATVDRVWVYSRDSIYDRQFSTQLSNTNTIKDIRILQKLLDTAIVLGKRAASLKQKPPTVSLPIWIWSLISQYHLTHPTPKLMREAAKRFDFKGQEFLAEWAEQKAFEETGHDRLALQDIRSLGYRAEAVVNAFMPPSAKLLVDYFVNCAQASDPIGVLGYSYTLERIALAVEKKHIQVIKATLPSGVDATRCLRVHSSLGSDVEHVEETLKTVAKLTQDERNQIALTCYETAKLYFSSHYNDFPSTTELQHKLQSFKD